MSDRAVSNTLGFIVIFSLVLFSIALISTAGIQGLQDTRDATMSQNAELSMQNVADAVQDVHRENESRRTASIRLGRGTLQPGPLTTINVTVSPSSGDDVELNGTFRPIVYRLDDTVIAYEGTSVIREQREGAALVREPSFVLEDDHVVVPVVNTTNATGGTVSGSTAQLEMRRTGSRTHQTVIDSGSPTVEIDVDSTELRTDVWEEWLAPRTTSCTRIGPRKLHCEKDLTTGSTSAAVVARHVEIEYEIG